MLSNLLGIDFGLSRIGLAIFLHEHEIFLPLKVMHIKRHPLDWETINSIMSIYNPDKIILGLPLDFYNKESLMTKVTLKFSRELSDRYPKVEIVLQNELLTTREVSWRLAAYNLKKNKKNPIDSQAACVILEDYVSAYRSRSTGL